MIRIITDSTCDLSEETLARLGVERLPLIVNFGSESFRDGVDMSHEEFYRRLAQADELPTTSGLNPMDLAAVFAGHRARGDEVVGIFLSSELSSTVQSANLAREAVGEEGVYIVDSRQVTLGLGLLIERAAALRDSGLSAAGLASAVEELASRQRLVAVVDTLKYLKMGGRISAAAAVVGGMLGISPIVAVQNGRVELIGKSRGRKAALRWMSQYIQPEEIDFSLTIAFGHSDCPEAMRECMEHFSDLCARAPSVLTGSIGCVVGTHAGPGATGLTYFVKKRQICAPGCIDFSADCGII